MSDFVPLADLCLTITKGTTPNANDGGFSDQGVNFIKSESLSYDGSIDTTKFAFISEETNRRLKRSIIRDGDILYSIAGANLGKCGIARREHLPANTNQAVAIIRVDGSRASNRFISFYLRNSKFVQAVLGSVAQSAQPNVNLGEIGRFKIPSFSLREQHAIASVLGALDDKIELNRRMNETLEAMARAIFKDWFVDFGPTRAKMEGRAPYLAPEIWSLFPHSLNGDGKPEGWRRINLREAAEISSGGTPNKSDPVYWNGSIPWISPKVMTGLHVTDSDQRVTPAAVGNGTRLAPLGSVLLMVRGMGLHQGVRVSQARNDVAFNQDVKALVPRQISAAHLLFGMLDATPYLFSKVEASGHGTGTLPTGIIETVEFVSPNAEVYNELVAPIDLLNEKIALNNQESVTLAATRDLLLPKLMSGEIRVREAEAIVGTVA